MTTPYTQPEPLAAITGPTSLTTPQRADIQWALDQFKAKAKGYKEARDYYDGTHQLAFASEKLSSAFGKLFKAFADNLCPTIVETVKDRLKLDGFTAQEQQEGEIEPPAIQQDIDELWRRNRLMVRANQVHLDALIEGDSYVIVWPDREGIPTFYPNQATSIVVDYDDEQPGYIIKAAKLFPMRDKRVRLRLYHRDRIETFITQHPIHDIMPDRADSFITYIDDNPWPIPNPYDKVPVFHFGNRVSIGMSGCSELKEAIPVQDALNKSIADMLVAEEFYGVPQRYATGLEEVPPAELRRRYALIAGGIWASDNKDVKFGEFSTADISKFILISETFRKEMARVSRTPMHYFSLEGTMPSGESLRVSESPLMAKVKDRQESWGAVWGDAMRFALQLANKGDLEPQAKWLNTAPRDDDGEVQRAATKVTQLQIPYEQVWREMGYSEKQIIEFTKQREQRQQEQIELQRAKFAAGGPMASKQANGDSEVLR